MVVTRIVDRSADKVTILLMKQLSPAYGQYVYWELQLVTPAYPTLLFYQFILRKGEHIVIYEDDFDQFFEPSIDPNKGGTGMLVERSTHRYWQITNYDSSFVTPEWLREGIIYHIFPDRFRRQGSMTVPADILPLYGDKYPLLHTIWNEPMEDGRATGYYNRDFYGGNIPGIIEKLDYLAELGVTILYLSPIFKARSNHRYDTDNYFEIDSLLGTRADWEALVAATEKRGMRIILDGVFNHVSSDSAMFDMYRRIPNGCGACGDSQSPYRSWFLFRPPTPEDFLHDPCVDDGMGRTAYDHWPDDFNLPRLNLNNPSVQNYIYGPQGVAKHWLEQGASGWRLDAIFPMSNGYAKETFWKEFRQSVHEVKPDAALIGEVWTDGSPWLTGDQMDSVTNYRLRRAILGFVLVEPFVWNDDDIYPLTPSQFHQLIAAMLEDYPPQAMQAMMNILGSHDTNRMLFVLGGNKRAHSLAALLLFAMPGVPTIYYGDEVALQTVEPYGVMDLYNRAPYPWPDENGSHYPPPDQVMYSYYAELVALRTRYPALRHGSYQALLIDDEKSIYAFARIALNNIVVVVANKSAIGQVVSVDVAHLLPDGYVLQDALGGMSAAVKDGWLDCWIGSRKAGVYGLHMPICLDEMFPLIPETSGSYVKLCCPLAESIDAYHVYRSFFSSGGMVRLNQAPVPRDTPYIDRMLAANTWCYYQLVLLNKAGIIIGKTRIAAVHVGDPCGTLEQSKRSSVGDLTALPLFKTRASAFPMEVTAAHMFNVTLTWQPVLRASLYQVYRRLDNAVELLAQTPETTFRDFDALEGYTYTYWIAAVDERQEICVRSEGLEVEVRHIIVETRFRVQAPESTPKESAIYVIGNLGNNYPKWVLPGIPLTYKEPGIWEAVLSFDEYLPIEYKYTRGTWASVEKDNDCSEVKNRQVVIQDHGDGRLDILDTILRWNDVDCIGSGEV